MGLFSGIIHALIPSLISALFPTAIRQSGFAFPYSIGTAVFTGLTPLAMAWLSGSYGLAAPISQCLLGAAIALGLSVGVRFLPLHLGPVRRADADAVSVLGKER